MQINVPSSKVETAAQTSEPPSIDLSLRPSSPVCSLDDEMLYTAFGKRMWANQGSKRGDLTAALSSQDWQLPPTPQSSRKPRTRTRTTSTCGHVLQSTSLFEASPSLTVRVGEELNGRQTPHSAKPNRSGSVKSVWMPARVAK